MKSQSTRCLAVFAPVFAVALSTTLGHAADCPSSDMIKDGFVLHSSTVESEVVRGAGPTTRVINTYSDFPKQTAFFYRGLFELYTTSRVSQISRNFMADLDAFFPLKKGDRHRMQYVSIKSDEVPGSIMTMKIEVAGEEEITLGDCRYDVFVVKQIIEKDKKEIDSWSALYSPELEMTLAKRYAEGTANEAIVRYTNIFPWCCVRLRFISDIKQPMSLGEKTIFQPSLVRRQMVERRAVLR